MRLANERRRYTVTSSLIGWVHTQKDPCAMAPVYAYMCHWAEIFFRIVWNKIIYPKQNKNKLK